MNYNIKRPLVSIIIPTYKREMQLIRALKSIENSIYKNLEVIIIDMSESTNQLEQLINTKIKSLEKVKIIKGYEDMYVSGAMNEGIQHTNGDYILICADDVVIEEDTIQKLVDILLNHNEIGIIAPICYYLNEPKRIWWAGSKVNMWTSRTYFYGRDLPLPNTEIFETDSFTTIALIRKELFYENGKTFFVDQREFPIHNEEADFSFRAKMRGWRICMTKNSKAYHDVPTPEKDSDLLRLFHVHTKARAYYTARNRILFQKKYSKWWQFLIFILIFNWLFTSYYLRVIFLGSKRPFKERLNIAKAYLKGILDGIKLKVIKTNNFSCILNQNQILYPPTFKNFKKVIIIGNYGPGNFGDEVMLDVILSILPEQCKVYIPTRSPETLKELHYDNRIIPIYFRNLWSIIKGALKSDAFLFGGGTIFTSGRGKGIDLALLLSLVLKLLAKKKIYFYGIGYSESTPIQLRILAKLLMQNENVFVRDRKSKELILSQMNVKPYLIKDLTFYWKVKKTTLPDEVKKIIESNKNAIIVGLAITSDLFAFKKEGELIKFLNYISLKYNTVVVALTFNPQYRGKFMERTSDFYLYKKIKEKLSKTTKFYILSYYPPPILFEIVNHVDLMVGMRYHSLIAAHLHSKHIIGIAVFDKQETFLIEHDYPYIRLNELKDRELIKIFEESISSIGVDQK